MSKIHGTCTGWLVWSIEHNAWWKPNGNGYTRDRAEAGRFTFLEAATICEESNKRNLSDPDEAMCPEWEKV
jgi:hypothetical protein